MERLRVGVCTCMLVVWCVGVERCFGQSADEAKPIETNAVDSESVGTESDDSGENLRERRLQKMVEVVSELEISIEGQANRLSLRQTPVLRYSNPNRGRYNDGAIFILSDDDGRPHATVACSIRGTGVLFLEVVSTSGQPLSGRLQGFGRWMPVVGGSGPREAVLQPPAGQSAVRRLAAMRQVARSITFEFRKKEWTEARLLSQPIHRFRSPAAGIVDGAIFGYAESNDPEGILLVWLEAAKDGKPAKWNWLASASTSLPLRCHERSILRWGKDGFWTKPRTPKSSYVEFSRGKFPDLVPAASSDSPNSNSVPEQ